MKKIQSIDSPVEKEDKSPIIEDNVKNQTVDSKDEQDEESKSVAEELEHEPIQTAPGIHTLVKTTQTHSKNNSKLSAAYTAFQQGDLQTAQQMYTQVLETEPNNRDALLGLASSALQQGQSAKAQYYYQRVLELYPQDSYGQVGLVNALAQRAPEYSESQLKSLLETSPKASYIHFSLGNLYAQQSRWTQAQQAYFSAYQYDTHNPDYAYNLAVSLDQINQPRLALSYYQKALQLLKKQKVTYHFNPQAAQQRIRTLTAYYRGETE